MLHHTRNLTVLAIMMPEWVGPCHWVHLTVYCTLSKSTRWSMDSQETWCPWADKWPWSMQQPNVGITWRIDGTKASSSSDSVEDGVVDDVYTCTTRPSGSCSSLQTGSPSSTRPCSSALWWMVCELQLWRLLLMPVGPCNPRAYCKNCGLISVQGWPRQPVWVWDMTWTCCPMNGSDDWWQASYKLLTIVAMLCSRVANSVTSNRCWCCGWNIISVVSAKICMGKYWCSYHTGRFQELQCLCVLLTQLNRVS
jgi:hypothetical protein